MMAADGRFLDGLLWTIILWLFMFIYAIKMSIFESYLCLIMVKRKKSVPWCQYGGTKSIKGTKWKGYATTPFPQGYVLIVEQNWSHNHSFGSLDAIDAPVRDILVYCISIVPVRIVHETVFRRKKTDDRQIKMSQPPESIVTQPWNTPIVHIGNPVLAQSVMGKLLSKHQHPLIYVHISCQLVVTTTIIIRFKLEGSGAEEPI